MEIEFKFGVAPQRAKALMAAVMRGKASHTQLAAHYFDTPDARLAGAQAALRVRREGERWVQTAKAIANGPLVRLEDNVDLGPVSGTAVPAPDWRRHAGSPVGALLAKLLHAAPALQATYGTDIARVSRRVKHGNSVLELALDHGRIVAQQADGARVEWPVHELEIELISGQVDDLRALAAQWVQRHGLWVDTRSKAERGERLLRGDTHWPAKVALPLDGPPHRRAGAKRAQFTGRAVQAAALSACLAHLLPNLDAVCAGEGSADHVHQARVALRRLRVVLRELGPLAPAFGLAPETSLAHVAAALTKAFRALGDVRNVQAVAPQAQADLAHALVHHGLVANALADQGHAAATAGLVQAMRDPALQRVLMALMVRAATATATATADSDSDSDSGAASPQAQVTTDGAQTEAASVAGDAAALASSAGLCAKATRAHLVKRLARLHQGVRKAAKGWASLSIAERHALRKRIKRLRYLAEFAQPVLAPKGKARARGRRFSSALATAQARLGAYTDAVMAQDAVGDAPIDWFVRGFWAAQAQHRDPACAKALHRLRQAEPFWR